MTEKLLLIIGCLVVLVIAVVFVTQIGIKPADVKIIEILEEKRESLLSLDGVVGAGIARDENNHIIGMAVYVAYHMTDVHEIPNRMGEFTVYVKDLGMATEYEKEKMIIKNSYIQLLNVTTDSTVYSQYNTITVIIKNKSNETVTFGDSAYDLFSQKWDDGSWEFYTGTIGLEVITYLHPGETAEITYRLGGETEKPFPSGRYRAISRGWLDHNDQTIHMWGCAEFTVE